MGLWASIKGTTQAYFNLGISGVRLKNSSGNLAVRNTADNADAEVTASKVNVSGTDIVINSDAAGSAADWTYTIKSPSSGMSAAVSLTLPTTDGSSNEFLTTDGSGVLSWAAAGDTSLCSKINSTSLAFGDTSTISMFTLPANAVIEWVRVIIDTAFNGTAPTISVGISGNTSKYMASTESNLKGTVKDVYYAYPGEVASGTTESIELAYSADSSSAGAARVEVSYAVPA
jgi:hypothetical protein